MERVGAVIIGVFNGSAIVAGKDDEGVVSESELVKGFQNLSDCPVEFLNDIASCSAFAGSSKPWVGNHGFVDVVGCEIKEERLVLAFLYEFDGFGCQGVCDVFVHPAGGFSSCHIADSADAVHNSFRVGFIGFHFKEFGVFHSCGIITDFVFVTYRDRIGGVSSGHFSVFDEHARDSVPGGGDNEGVIESYVERPRFYFNIEINWVFLCSESEVPFSNNASLVARLFEEGCHGRLFRRNGEGRDSAEDVVGGRVSPGVLAG